MAKLDWTQPAPEPVRMVVDALKAMGVSDIGYVRRSPDADNHTIRYSICTDNGRIYFEINEMMSAETLQSFCRDIVSYGGRE